MTDFKDIFSCSVCLGIYKAPKRLPDCTHVYCKHCIESLAAQNGGNRLTCPDCRKDQYLPGIEDLLDDLKLNHVMTYFRCADCQEIHPETSPCTECKSNTCATCRTKHSTGIICDIISRLRLMKRKQPEQERADQLDQVGTKWQELQTQLTDLKSQVTASFEAIQEALVAENKKMLAGIDGLDTKAEQRLASVNQIKKAPDFVRNTWETIQEFSGDEAARVLITAKVHEEALSAMEKMLTEDMVRIADIDVKGVMAAIEKMGKQLSGHADEEEKKAEDAMQNNV